MTTKMYTRHEFDAGLQRFKPRRNRSGSLETMVMSYFQRLRPDCKIEKFHITGTQNEIDCLNADGFCGHCNTVFEADGNFYHYRTYHEVRPALSEEVIQGGTKTGEMDEIRKQYIADKDSSVVELWECQRWDVYKTDVSVKEHLRESFPYRRLLCEDQSLNKTKSGRLFGYVQCDLKIPEPLKYQFAKFPPLFKDTNVCRQDIGPSMQEYAERKESMTQPRRMLIYSLDLSNGTVDTPLLLFYLKLELVCREIYLFVSYSPVNCFDNFELSAVNARRQGEENHNSSVDAETMKLFANNSYGLQNMDCSHHSITKYTNDEKANAAINNRMFQGLGKSTVNFMR